MSTSAEADSNRCAPNVVGQFNDLKSHGELMGFHDGGAAVEYPQLGTGTDHWQGVQRLAFPPTARNLLILTSSHANDWGHYALVGLGSQFDGGFTGRRFGGNRMQQTTQDWNVAPQGNDIILQKGKIHPVFNHPGGLQSIGRFVAFPLEQVGTNDRPGRTQLFDAGSALDFNTKHCTTTTRGCMESRWVMEHSEEQAGAVGLTKLDDGRYLMINGVTQAMKKLELNVSRLKPDGTPYRIDESDVFGASNCRNCAGAYSAKFVVDREAMPSWQVGYSSLQLIDECVTGYLYLVGNIEESGRDWLDLFRLNLRPVGINREGEPVLSTTPPSRAFLHVSRRRFWCTYQVSDRQCDFDAAVGVYVDPKGTLLVYATVHDDSAPVPGVTRFVEFAPNNPVDDPSTRAVEECDSVDKMWVELSNGMVSTGRGGLPPREAERFFVEHANANRSNSSFDKAYRFNDQARSIRYCLPTGYRYKLCEHSEFAGSCLFLCGSSAPKCRGPISNGSVRWFNLPTVNSSSGCFTRTTDSTCL